jgi:aryl carrier-like protein
MVANKVTLVVALVDVGPEDWEVLRQTCLAAGYSPILKAVGNQRVDRVGRRADLILVGSDLSFRALHWAERARRAGMATVGVLVNWWSDLEWDARQAADFVLHTPLTPDEVLEVLRSSVPGYAQDSPVPAVAGATSKTSAASSPLRWGRSPH